MTKSEKLRYYLEKSKKDKFALPAINVTNMETSQIVVEAAEELKAPVIMQITESSIKYAGFDYVEAIFKVAKKSDNIFPHLDHGMTEEVVMQCINSEAFSSVMIDCSKKDFTTNASMAKKIKDNSRGKLVEAELGIVGGKEEDIIADGSIYTDINEALDFIKISNVDLLAIAVGTAHGVYKNSPKLNYDLINKISAKTMVPLVLHGSSGLTDEQLHKSVQSGISKVNLDTEIKQSYIQGFMDYLSKNPNVYDLRKVFGNAKAHGKETIKHKIIVLGANNKM